MQGIANDRPEIAQRVFKNREKSIGATGFEPATQCSQTLGQEISSELR